MRSMADNDNYLFYLVFNLFQVIHNLLRNKKYANFYQ